MAALLDTCVERDGPCRTKPKYLWSYPSEVAKYLQEQEKGEEKKSILLVDVRSFALYCGKHIKTSVNLSFSPILMRRLLKGVLTLDSLITDTQLLDTIASSEHVLLYDTNSTPSNTRPELIKLIEMLQNRFDGKLNLRVLLGGIDSFQLTFGDLCTSERPDQVTSPTIVTLDTSNISTSIGAPEATPVQILPFLYLGSAKDSADLRVLQKMNITAVLNITTSCPNHFESYLEYKSIPVEDTEHADLLSRLQTAIAFIDYIKAKGGSVFVHCHAGISRSATVCIAYLMQKKQMTVSDAYKFVQSKRPIISPNLGFMGQLMLHQKNLQTIWSTTASGTSKTTNTITNTANSTNNTTIASHYSSPLPSLPEVSCYKDHPKPSTLTSRSISVPGIGLRRKSRDGLKLSLNDELTRSTGSNGGTHQISPCRVEAVNNRHGLSLSLNLPTTCT